MRVPFVQGSLNVLDRVDAVEVMFTAESPETFEFDDDLELDLNGVKGSDVSNFQASQSNANDDEVIPETSSESEEDNAIAVDHHLLTPTSIHAPPNQNSETSPDLFSEASVHSNHDEVALDNGAGSQHSLAISYGHESDDIFSSMDAEIPPSNIDYVSKTPSSEGEPNTESDHLENVVIPESEDSESSSESENVDVPDLLSNDVIRRTPENENPADNVYISETSSEDESDRESSSIENVTVMETEVSESDTEGDTNLESHDVPSQNESVFIPETNLSESDDDADELETNFPVENEVIIPETSSESEENDPAVDDHLTPTSIHAPPNQDTQTSPDVFSEASAHSNQHESADNSAGSENSFVIAEEPMTTTTSPSLFGDDNVSETFSIVAETESASISAEVFNSEAFEVPYVNQQDTEDMSGIHQDSEDSGAILLADEASEPFIVQGTPPAEESIILPQNESVEIVPLIIENQNHSDSDDDDITIMPDINNPIVISAESRAMIERIERFIAGVVEDLKNGSKIQIAIQNRSDWNNCFIENERYVLLPIADARCRHIKSTFCLSVIFFVLAEIHGLLSTNRRCTIRELYYKNVNITQKQENVSEALKTICCLLDATPWQLGVLSTSKGLIAGPLEIHLPDNSIVDCSIDRNGITLPHLTAGIIDLKTTATRIFLVEKDTVFKNLLQNNLLERWNHSCILITGKGYPDTNTRLILNKLRELHSLPIDILTDADPYGVEIMLTYRHGSLSMSNLAESLAVPSVRWLGIFPSDIRKFGIRAVPLTEEDKRKLDNILNRPFINDHVHRELLIMKQINLKAEIEGISESSCTYLIDVYLRNKIDSNTSI